MQRALVIALILVLVLLSLPVLISMGAMDPCPACPAAGMLGLWGLCLVVLALFTISLPGATSAFGVRSSVTRPRLVISGIERPPRNI
jgi:hypothetical protein